MGLCGRRGTDCGFSDVSLLRDSTHQLTAVAGEKADNCLSKCKEGLAVICGGGLWF